MFSPLLLLLLVIISFDGYGRSLIRLQRAAKEGKSFFIYKVRTMYPGTENITPLGKFLRNTGLDEIPQLINVIKGEMSLVGPRPEMPHVAKDYTSEQKKRLAVIPGITGPWQLSDYRNKPIHEHIEFDIEYIKKSSPLYDLSIFIKTVAWMFSKIFQSKI